MELAKAVKNGFCHAAKAVLPRENRTRWRMHVTTATLNGTSLPPPSWLLSMLIASAEHAIIFGGNYFGLPPSSCWLVWDKDNGGSDFADCELAWTNLDKAVRKFLWRWNGMLQEDMKNKELRVHPTQKPLPLMHWCLSHVPEAKSVLDPFMGSGTTLLACKQKGIKAVGIDRDERYCEEAAKRLSQKTIFEVLKC